MSLKQAGRAGGALLGAANLDRRLGEEVAHRALEGAAFGPEAMDEPPLCTRNLNTLRRLEPIQEVGIQEQ